MAEAFGYVLGFLVSVTAGLIVIGLQLLVVVAIFVGGAAMIIWLDSKIRK